MTQNKYVIYDGVFGMFRRNSKGHTVRIIDFNGSWVEIRGYFSDTEKLKDSEDLKAWFDRVDDLLKVPKQLRLN